MGSKRRLAKHLLPIILKDREEGQWYVEPFVGGANMIENVDGNRIGADSNEYLIECLKLIRDDLVSVPTKVTEKDYNEAKASTDTPTAIRGYIGFQLSYGGKFFGGYRRDRIGKRNYSLEAWRNSAKQSAKIQGVRLAISSYEQLEIPQNSIIYCDPPYANATRYKDDFNHNAFWDWCRKKVADGHKVFVSEYTAPDDFVSVWQKEIVSSLTKDTGSKTGIEKLFVHKSQLPE